MDEYWLLIADGLIEQWGEFVGTQSLHTLLYPIKFINKPIALGMQEINISENPAYNRFPVNVTTMEIYPKSSSAYYKWYLKGF